MADDLNDDFFVKEDISGGEEEVIEKNDEVIDVKKAKKTKKAGKKRKLNENGEDKDENNENIDANIPVENGEANEANEEVKKKKKKRKKKKVEKKLEEMPTSANSLWDYFEVAMKKRLSSLEFAEIQPEDDEWFVQVDKESEEKRNTSSYLKQAIGNWETMVDKHTKKERKASPLLLIISLGGQRCVDALRETKEFRGENCKTAKLFAKHFKLADHVKWLSTNIVHLGVGTPNRILKLIEEDGLNLKHLQYVMIDWSWRDVKTRNISNMPGVKEDLVKVFEEHLFKRCKMKKLKIGIF